VVRLYADPPFWQSEIDEWASRHGEKAVCAGRRTGPGRWPTRSSGSGQTCCPAASAHDGCPVTSKHIENAHADHRLQGVLIRKDRSVSRNKIDAAMSSALAHEAALDITAAGEAGRSPRSAGRSPSMPAEGSARGTPGRRADLIARLSNAHEFERPTCGPERRVRAAVARAYMHPEIQAELGERFSRSSSPGRSWSSTRSRSASTSRASACRTMTPTTSCGECGRRTAATSSRRWPRSTR
jgi:predicted RNA-binding Zn-ribbon protein involved in translation (DUF1610 family)